MKYILLLVFSAISLLITCKDAEKSAGSNKSAYPEIDSVRLANCDTLAYKIGRRWHPDSAYYKKFFFNGKDSIEYIELNGEPQRVSAIISSDSGFVWLVFYQANNELIQVRYREKMDLPVRTVKEAYSYLENGKIFYSKEHSRALKEGEPLGLLRLDTFKVNYRSPQEMEAEYAPYVEQARAAIELYRKGLQETSKPSRN